MVDAKTTNYDEKVKAFLDIIIQTAKTKVYSYDRVLGENIHESAPETTVQ